MVEAALLGVQLTHGFTPARPLNAVSQRREASCAAVSMLDAGTGGALAAAVLGGGALAATMAGGSSGPAIDDKKEVEAYFNDASGDGGFSRWNKIYSETGEINTVQQDIRDGHQITIDQVLTWVDDAPLTGETMCDVGCGVGSLAIPLATRGATVSASDISAAMATEAARRAEAAGVSERASFATSDLESVTGRYDTVSCIDVLIHYPSDKMADMVSHLGSIADKRILISFAPKTPVLSVLKKVGSLFPGPSKATRAYLHTEEDVRAALKAAGFEIKRQHLTSSKFYFSQLFEATRTA